jgi:hypothetical protein
MCFQSGHGKVAIRTVCWQNSILEDELGSTRAIDVLHCANGAHARHGTWAPSSPKGRLTYARVTSACSAAMIPKQQAH